LLILVLLSFSSIFGFAISSRDFALLFGSAHGLDFIQKPKKRDHCYSKEQE
jgi:hypothetical protein